MPRLLGSIAQGAPWASGLPVPRSLCNRWRMVCSRGGDRAACVKHCLSDLSGATGWCKVDWGIYENALLLGRGGPSGREGACSCGGNASRTAYYTHDLAETIIESLYPKKFYHNVPSMTSSAFVTKNLKKSEWVNNPEAVEAVKKEAVGLRSNQTWDDSSVTTLANLKLQSKISGNRVKIANLLTLCGLKHAEQDVHYTSTRDG